MLVLGQMAHGDRRPTGAVRQRVRLDRRDQLLNLRRAVLRLGLGQQHELDATLLLAALDEGLEKVDCDMGRE